VSTGGPVIPHFDVGDVVETRKRHPCGSVTWEIYRTGMDIGVRCQGCGRHVMMPRPKFERRVRRVLRRAVEGSAQGDGNGARA
jgi:hypothetical protein